MKALSIIKLAGMILLAFAVIAVPAAAFTSVTITDATGATISITEEPQRIVSLTPTVAEILFAIGAGDRVVASAENTNYPEEAALLPTVGSYASLNMERIITFVPDLLISEKTMIRAEELEYLRNHGCKVVIVEADDIESAMESFITIGKAVGCTENAETLVKSIQDELKQITDITLELNQEKPTVAHLLWYDPIFVSGTNTMQDEIIRAAGCDNAFSSVSGWGVVNIEQFLVVNPDIIIINTSMGEGETSDDVIATYFGNDARFKTLSAYKNNKIYVIDGDLVDRSGPRLIQGVEAVSRVAYPDIFGTYSFENTGTAKTPGFAPVLVLFGVAAAVFLRRRS